MLETTVIRENRCRDSSGSRTAGDGFSRRTLLALGVPLLGTLAGCNRRGSTPVAVDSTEERLAKLDIDILIDGTESIRGFIAATGSGAHFATFLEDMGSARFWFPETTLRHYLFADKVRPLTGDEIVAARVQPKFYSELETRIESVVQHASPGKLTVLVTDLFQHNNDVNHVAAAIVEKYIARGLAVGILGVRSAFRGDIFDIGLHRGTLRNFTGSRPFYALCLGRQADIEVLFDKLPRRVAANGAEWNALILGPWLAQPARSYQKIATATRLGVSKVRGLVRETTPNPLRLQLTVKSSRRSAKASRKMASGEPAWELFQATHELRQCRFTVPYRPELVTCDAVFSRYTGQEERKQSGGCPAGPFCEVDGSREWIDVRDLRVGGGALQFTVDLKDSALRPEQLYRSRILLLPPESAYQFPRWLADWNLDLGGAFDGRRTLNLELFVSNLWNATLQGKPRLGEYYCYLKRI